jgi:hypothetical protein
VIKRATDLLPRVLVDELRRVGRDVVAIRAEEPPRYSVSWLVDSPLLRRTCPTSSDMCGTQVNAAWVNDGPKVVQVSQRMQELLGQVEVRLELKDYEQPFPAVLVELDVPPFTSCLCYRHSSDVLILNLFSVGNADNICCVVRQLPGRMLEESLNILDADCVPLLHASLPTQRIAVNAMLCMVDAGFRRQFALPLEVERDQRLAARGNSDAAKRVHVELLSFEQETRLRDAVRGEPCNPTGAEVSPHWRSAHWRMQPHGPKNSLRKRILVPRVMVRRDLFVGDDADTSACYKGGA